MMQRNLTSAELRQRRDAPAKHGAFATKIGPEPKVTYRRLLRRVSRAGMRTDPVMRMRLELLARVLVSIERVDRWLAQQSDPVFAPDGRTHGVLGAYFEWIRTAARILDKFPADLGVLVEDDFALIAAKVRGG